MPPLSRKRHPLQNLLNPFNMRWGVSFPPSTLALSLTQSAVKAQPPRHLSPINPRSTSKRLSITHFRLRPDSDTAQSDQDPHTALHRGGGKFSHLSNYVKLQRMRLGLQAALTQNRRCHAYKRAIWKSPLSPEKLFSFPQLPTPKTNQSVPEKHPASIPKHT